MKRKVIQKRGAVLVYVVMIMALMSVLGIGILFLARHSAETSATEVYAEQSYLSAKSSLESVMTMMENDPASSDAVAVGLKAAGNRTSTQELTVGGKSIGTLSVRLSCVSYDEPCTVIRIDATVSQKDTAKTATGYLKHSSYSRAYGYASTYAKKSPYDQVSTVNKIGTGKGGILLRDFSGSTVSALNSCLLSATDKAALLSDLIDPMISVWSRHPSTVMILDAAGGSAGIKGNIVYLNEVAQTLGPDVTRVVIRNAGSLNIAPDVTANTGLTVVCEDIGSVDLVTGESGIFNGWIIVPNAKVTLRSSGVLTVNGGLICDSLGNNTSLKNTLVLNGQNPLEVWYRSYENPVK